MTCAKKSKNPRSDKEKTQEPFVIPDAQTLLKRRRTTIKTAEAIVAEAAEHPGPFDAATIETLRQRAFELITQDEIQYDSINIILRLMLKLRDQEHKQEEIALKLRRLEWLETQAAEAKEQLAGVLKCEGLSPETLRKIEDAAALL